MQILESNNPMQRFPDSMTREEAEIRSNKLYLVLIEYLPSDDVDSEQSWQYCRGTQTVYDYLKEVIINADDQGTPVNFNNSFIIVEGSPKRVAQPLPIYDFIKTMVEKGKVIDDTGFNVDEFVYTDEDPDNETKELRYGQGEQPEQYTEVSNTVNGGEV